MRSGLHRSASERVEKPRSQGKDWCVRNVRTGTPLKPLPIPERLLGLKQDGGSYPVLERYARCVR
jgi:hypothetical protein